MTADLAALRRKRKSIVGKIKTREATILFARHSVANLRAELADLEWKIQVAEAERLAAKRSPRGTGK